MTEKNKQESSQTEKCKIKTRISVLPQYIIPQHLLSLLMFKLTRWQWVWFKDRFIEFMVKRYDINIDEAVTNDPSDYRCFNDFFTRALKPDVRPIAEATLVSPVDGVISQSGHIECQQLIQAKGHHYSLLSLLGGDEGLTQQMTGGQFATIYLSPRDYHRIHMPVSGRLKKMRYIPGKLFSVNRKTVSVVPELFARNERLVITFDTEIGLMVMVMVGAIFVGSMSTVWQGDITPAYGKVIRQWTYDNEVITLEKGEEMGRFNMGSTVILLTAKQASQFDSDLTEGKSVQVGQALL